MRRQNATEALEVNETNPISDDSATSRDNPKQCSRFSSNGGAHDCGLLENAANDQGQLRLPTGDYFLPAYGEKKASMAPERQLVSEGSLLRHQLRTTASIRGRQCSVGDSGPSSEPESVESK